jgi:formate dehydrogenase gamma subunit
MSRRQTPAPTQYRRFTGAQRIEHALLVLSFTVLAITGLPQKYPDTFWGSGMIQWMGGIELVRIIHRAAAILLIVETIYHFVIVLYKIWVLRLPLTMLPSLKDVTDALQTLRYNLYLAKSPPAMGRYSFGEKAEYWAVIWGTVIMVVTGFVLWNPIAATYFLPGEFVPAAKAAHGGEALLAVLSIITWHVYNVHIKQFNKSMFTGYISQHEMEEEHKLELAELNAGLSPPKALPPDLYQRRQRLFLQLATVVSLVLLIALYFFVTFEQTAITTVPRDSVEIFVPATPTAVNGD